MHLIACATDDHGHQSVSERTSEALAQFVLGRVGRAGEFVSAYTGALFESLAWRLGGSEAFEAIRFSPQGVEALCNKVVCKESFEITQNGELEITIAREAGWGLVGNLLPGSRELGQDAQLVGEKEAALFCLSETERDAVCYWLAVGGITATEKELTEVMDLLAPARARWVKASTVEL